MTTKVQTSSVVEACDQIVGLSRRAVEWIGKPVNRSRAGESYGAKLRMLRKNARLAGRLRAAANNPPSIAVYGASQAGKSYLISHLAAPPVDNDAAEREVARVLPHARPGGISFLEINPGGGNESTGLVTRFTRRPIPVDNDFPVLVRLLTVLDLAKIVIGCSAIDLKPVETDRLRAETIAKKLDDIARLPRTSLPLLDEDDIFELKDLRENEYHHLAGLSQDDEELAAARYWERAGGMVSGLSVDGLTQLLAPLWCEIPRLTTLFGKLCGALQTLGLATEVRCRLEALDRVDPETRRATTILDVATLVRLMSGTDEKIDIRHAGGIARLDRPVVTALAAELVMDLAGATRPFLETLDLLDFPGARSRAKIERSKLDETEGTERVFLRGKVAHLFDRYREDYDLTSMILCVGSSVQEVADLPDLINRWVESTHGATPEERARSSTTLFLVLTKFDELLRNTEGQQPGDPHRWRARLEASVHGFLGRAGNWTTEWTPGRRFNNVFWYRSPAFEQPHIFELAKRPDGGTIETGIRPGFRDDLDAIRASYMALDEIKEQIGNHELAWNAVMMPNDGGITYLADSIARVGRTPAKLDQIAMRIEKIRADSDAALKPYYFESDLDAQRKQRRADAMYTCHELAKAGDRQMFARALSRLTVQQEELERLCRMVRLREEDVDGNGAAPSTQKSSTTDPLEDKSGIWGKIMGQIGNGAGAAPAGAPPPASAPKPVHHNDLASLFGRRTFRYWADKVQQTCYNPEFLHAYGLTSQGALTVASELVAGGTRLDLASRVAAASRPSWQFASTDLSSPTSALCGVSVINDFVVHLGRGTVVADETLPKDRTSFARPPDRDEPSLSSQPATPWADYCGDWIISFLDLVDANVVSGSGPNFDPVENAALGDILGQLRSIQMNRIM